MFLHKSNKVMVIILIEKQTATAKLSAQKETVLNLD